MIWKQKGPKMVSGPKRAQAKVHWPFSALFWPFLFSALFVFRSFYFRPFLFAALFTFGPLTLCPFSIRPNDFRPFVPDSFRATLSLILLKKILLPDDLKVSLNEAHQGLKHRLLRQPHSSGSQDQNIWHIFWFWTFFCRILIISSILH